MSEPTLDPNIPADVIGNQPHLMTPKIIQILQESYITIEDERVNSDGVREHLWWTTHYYKEGIKQEVNWSPASPLREDGANWLHKVGDEVLSFIVRDEEGRTGCVLYPADPAWSKEDLWREFASRRESLLGNEHIPVDKSPQSP